MSNLKGHLLRAGALLVLAGGAAACDKPIRAPAPAPTPTSVVVTQQEDKFGAGFATAFRASANSQPVAVQDGDVIPLSLIVQPLDIN